MKHHHTSHDTHSEDDEFEQALLGTLKPDTVHSGGGGDVGNNNGNARPWFWYAVAGVVVVGVAVVVAIFWPTWFGKGTGGGGCDKWKDLTTIPLSKDTSGKFVCGSGVSLPGHGIENCYSPNSDTTKCCYINLGWKDGSITCTNCPYCNCKDNYSFGTMSQSCKDLCRVAGREGLDESKCHHTKDKAGDSFGNCICGPKLPCI